MSLNRLTGVTIVVVEDHNDVRTFMGLWLGSIGANVESARLLNGGFQACLQKPFTVQALMETILSLL